VCADIEVVGTAIYMGTDVQAKQQSALFSGTDAIEQVINDQNINVRKRLDDVETMLK
jgi:hypothetical protein